MDRRSFGRRHPDVVGSEDFGVENFGQDVQPLETSIFPRCGQEDELVLIIEAPLELLQARLKADQTRCAKGIAFAFRFVGDLGEST